MGKFGDNVKIIDRINRILYNRAKLRGKIIPLEYEKEV